MDGVILAIDLGRFNSVCCWYGGPAVDPTFRTVATSPAEFRRELLRRPVAAITGRQPGLDADRAGRPGPLARPLADCSAAELWRGELAVLLARHRFLEGQLADVEAALDTLAAAHPGVRLLTTIPGVGV